MLAGWMTLVIQNNSLIIDLDDHYNEVETFHLLTKLCDQKNFYA